MKHTVRSFLRLACDLCGADRSRLRILLPGAARTLCLMEERFRSCEDGSSRCASQMEIAGLGSLLESPCPGIHSAAEPSADFGSQCGYDCDELVFRRASCGLEIELALWLDSSQQVFSNERALRAMRLLELFETILDHRGFGHIRKSQQQDNSPFDPPMVGNSTSIVNIKRFVRSVAKSDVSVLVEGETGTGKEIVARNLHRLSGRNSRPLVIVGSSEMPPSLLQSELFGHVEGAFTGASRDRAGLVESANGGTFFLDEIGELSLPLQSALLRVLQEKEVRRIGESKRRKIDTRFIFATNRDLEELVKRGRFRRDLYFRISVARIHMPPLRERPEDILPLAEHFLSICAEREGKATPAISPSAAKKLLLHDWPGNVRELRNEMERVYALYGAEMMIRAEMLSLRLSISSGISVTSPSSSTTIPGAVENLERRLICETLARTGGNRTRAARALGITRQGLLKKLKRYSILG